MCVGCRARFPQADLVRFVRDVEGWKADSPSSRHRQPGRGAYLCSAACIARAAKNRRYPGLASVAGEYGLISSSLK
ncbi:MAG: YlxR family protein [Vulcanimicrobiaceae bacterium]